MSETPAQRRYWSRRVEEEFDDTIWNRLIDALALSELSEPEEEGESDDAD